MTTWEQFCEDMNSNQMSMGLKKLYGSNSGVSMGNGERDKALRARQILRPVVARLQKNGLTTTDLPIITQVINNLLMGNSGLRTNVSKTNAAFQQAQQQAQQPQ